MRIDLRVRGGVCPAVCGENFHVPDGGTISSFKVIQTNDTIMRLVGIISCPFVLCHTEDDVYYNNGGNWEYGNLTFCTNNYQYGGEAIIIFEYFPNINTFNNIGNAQYNGYAECHNGQPAPNFQGKSWSDISPINASKCYATWEYDGCGKPPYTGNNSSYYNLYFNNNLIFSYNNVLNYGNFAFTSQDAFFHPMDSTILYYFDDSYQFASSGLYISHFGDTSPKKWQLLKPAPNFSNFYIPPDFSNTLFFTANDTLYQSPDTGATWNMAAVANVKSIAYYPNGKYFFACARISPVRGSTVPPTAGKRSLM